MNVTPLPLDAEAAPTRRLITSPGLLREALALGEKHGYRNAQAT